MTTTGPTTTDAAALDRHARVLAHASARRREQRRRTWHRSVAKHVALSVVALSMLLPFAWMITTSLKPNGDVFSIPPQWVPTDPQWQHYLEVFDALPFARFFLNTTGYTLAVMAGEVLVSIVVAYGFARFDFRWKKPLFLFLLVTIMLPGEITIVPGYIFWAEVGDILGLQLINTYWPLILPALGGQAVHVFFLFQFFRSIPRDFAEAAYLNGAGWWTILWRVFVPMSRPAVVTVAVTAFMGTWNAFLGPLIYLNDVEKFTVQVGLTMFRGQFETNWPLLMAATTLSIVPVLVLFFTMQRYFVPSNASEAVR
jgi:multiple sugar transport system permease protein